MKWTRLRISPIPKANHTKFYPLPVRKDKIISGGNNGVVRPGRCGAQSAVLGPEGREMKFSIKY